MLKKIIYLIVYLFCTLSLSQTITLSSYLIGRNRQGGNITKNTGYSILSYLYQNGFNSPIYYNGIYKKTNKVDIIISNHIHLLDFAVLVTLIKQFDNRDIYFVIRKEVIFIPGTGFVLASAPDIKLNRKIENDIDNLKASIKKIKSGIIVISPEGTRFTNKKHELSKKYSIDNNLTVYKNTLYPKMKGMWLICNILINENRMGNIIDITNGIDNFKNKDGNMINLLTTDLGNTYSIISNYKVPLDNSIKEYDNFKKWFLTIWDKKDNILDNIFNKNTFIYKKVKTDEISSNYILLVFITSLFIYLIVSTNGKYLLYSLIVSYIICLIKYKMIVK